MSRRRGGGNKVGSPGGFKGKRGVSLSQPSAPRPVLDFTSLGARALGWGGSPETYPKGVN